MIELTDLQIELTRQRLLKEGLDYDPLKEELLDHICCVIEKNMTKGMSFHKACEEAFLVFGKDEIQKLQIQTIRSLNQKSQLMKVFALSFVCMFGGLFSFLIWPSSSVETASSACMHKCCEYSEAVIALGNGTLDDPPSIQPIAGTIRITSGYGTRWHPVHKKKALHKGVDIKASIGTEVLATSDGLIEKALDWEKGYGKHIYVKHDENYTSMYAHLSEIKVKEGQQVKKGEVIGLVGNSGFSMAPHLHYEVLKNSKSIDPAPYMLTSSH